MEGAGATSARLHVCVAAAYGSHGDVQPMYALALTMARRGHKVALFVSSKHAARLLAREDAAELAETVVIDEPDVEDLWSPGKWGGIVKGPKAVARRWLLTARPLYAAIQARLLNDGTDVVVAHPLNFAARMLHDSTGVPFATVALAPWLLRSRHQCFGWPLVAQGKWAPPWLKGFGYRVLDLLLDSLVVPGELGLRKMYDDLVVPEHAAVVEHATTAPPPPPARVLDSWFHSPQCILGLWPAWYYPAQPDWPSQLVQCGFPLFDESSASGDDMDGDLAAFVAKEDKPLVVVTPGTTNPLLCTTEFFDAALAAVESAGARALLLTPHAPAVDAAPRYAAMRGKGDALQVAYAPLSAVLKRAARAALVHHGGIGTTAQALRSGTPSVVLANAFDQFDNAWAVAEHLGCGVRCVARAFVSDASVAAAAVRSVLASASLRARALAVSARFADASALAAASSAVEALAARAAP